VLKVGPDAPVLKPGDWVLCDATVRSRDNPLFPDIALQGLSARADGGLALQRYFRDGSFAEKTPVQTESAVPLGAIDPSSARYWCALGTLLVPFGGLIAGALQPGETVLVSGATGNFGSSAVAVALTMGAGAVVTPGRNTRILQELVNRFGARVRPYGHAVPMGGVGMLGGPWLELPYPWLMRNNIALRGAWIYSSDAPLKLVRLIASGQLNLHQWQVCTFSLDEIHEALHHAACEAGSSGLC